MIPRTGVVGDVLEALQKKANISDELMPKVRLYEAHSSKFYKYLPVDYSIVSIGEFFSLYAECFGEDDSPKKISVFHFDKEPNKVHGIPFQFPVKEVSANQPNNWIGN
jgi:ubiquitin carboxyl-terminal hydrolase 7